MAYKEYNAEKGKVLLNLKSFDYGVQVKISIKFDLELIQCNKSDSEYCYGVYDMIHDKSDEKLVETVRQELHKYLTDKGYDITNLAKPIIRK